MKKKYMLMGVAATLITTTIIGGSLAAFQADGSVRQNINTRSLKMALSDGRAAEGSLYLNIAMPGGEIEQDIKIENTADTPLYARVTIRKYWGDPAGDSSDLEKDYDMDADKISLEVNGDWMEDVSVRDQETAVYYYCRPISPGADPVDVLDSLKVAADLDNAYADKGIGLEVEAEAVQTYAAEDAILSEWGVWADIADDGTITAIEQ